MGPSTEGLSTHGLTVGHGGQALLGPLNLQLPAGRFVCLIGANGAGKSTLIRTLCGMQAAVAGEVRLGGVALQHLSATERARRLAVVLTERVDVAQMSGHGLVCLGRYPHLGWGGRLGPADHAAVQAALQHAGAQSLAHRLVSEMSDGERQKVLIARALAQQPGVLVLDEATAFLDLPRRIETMHLLLALAREQGLAVLLSTHDLELALRHADTLWLIDGERRLHAGAPEDLALDGSLAASFAVDGLAFDLERAELRVSRSAPRGIRIEGEGMALAWAHRALQRAGYAHDADAALAVHTTAHGAYRLQQGAQAPMHFTTLGALVDALAQRAGGGA